MKASEQHQNSASIDASAKQEAIAKEVNTYMQTIRDKISFPGNTAVII
ncbi:hypothetical protein A45J_2678 [hot springs metagenome]|uniref:Uncharacterized protein n=1 Tax=hot springs metagenome TaxID=433727 RepID=A0A5J4L6I1_9ZZZZ